MTYRTGSFVQANPAPYYVINILEPDLINVGYVLWSTGNITANQYNWRTYKSPAANNSIGSDWYIHVGWDTATNGNLLMTLSEGYSNTTNTITNYCPNTAPVPTGSFTANANPTALPNVTGSNSMYLATNAVSAFNATNTVYYHSVTIDRVIVAASNAAANINAGPSWYAGMYDSYMANTLDTMPLVLCNLNFSNPSNPPFSANNIAVACIFTREPNQAGANGTNFWGCYNMLNSWFSAQSQEVYQNRYLVTRALIYGRNTTQTTSNAVRGLLKDIWMCSFNTTRGDLLSFTLNGSTVNTTAVGTGSAVVNNQFPFVAQV